jgi:uncharacterized protein YllA (UPF0747 family)
LLAQSARTDATGLDRTELARRLLAPFEAALQEMRRTIERAGPGLTSAIEKTHATVQMAVTKLAGKYDKALLHQDQQAVDDVRLVKQLLYPQGVPQERFYGPSYFAARYGERAFVEQVLAAIDPFDPSPRDLVLRGSEADPAVVEVCP